VLQAQARALDLLDLDRLAREAGTAISAVLLGAIAASGVLPIPREAFEQAIRASGKGVEASLRGFARAFDAMEQRRASVAAVEVALAPEPAVDLRALARARLADYQDDAYAALYEQRLARIEAAERAADPARGHGGAIVHEVTRWLALWMAFDDIVRVAALKLAAGRQARVRRETGAADDEIVKVFDHFKPGVPEFAALLPGPWAQRLRDWDRRRIARGQDPWALPLKIGSHTVAGALALRAVAALKGQRRRGSRFALEQSLIERWLAAVERGTHDGWALGHELARCGRLVKGYGSTNERGKETLLHIVDHLAGGAAGADARAAAVRAACDAALADDTGAAFDRTALAHGAPARPPREQVVRWHRRRPAG
jgi:indolepyruvate ferredoxin oxidoreductase beta subunit